MVPKSVWEPVAGGWYCSRDMVVCVVCVCVCVVEVEVEVVVVDSVGWLVGNVCRGGWNFLQSPGSQASLSAKHVKEALPSALLERKERFGSARTTGADVAQWQERRPRDRMPILADQTR